MKEFNASILREKFTVRSIEGAQDEMVVPSNRMLLSLNAADGAVLESFIIRGRYIHEVARLGSQILQEFERLGPISPRAGFDWQALYDKAESKFDHFQAKGENWLAIYQEGKVIFEKGTRHPFLDIIEQCDLKNADEYDFSVAMAEDAFRKAGKQVKIEHLSTIALVLYVEPSSARCGLIFRSILKTSTFNYAASKKQRDVQARDMSAPACLNLSASFLEGIQLSFQIGKTNAALKGPPTSKIEEQELYIKKARRHLGQIIQDIRATENLYTVRYRPERPDFDLIIAESEKVMLESAK